MKTESPKISFFFKQVTAFAETVGATPPPPAGTNYQVAGWWETNRETIYNCIPKDNMKMHIPLLKMFNQLTFTADYFLANKPVPA